ncbi:MAG: hypothetical protein ACR2PX_26155 [Endozoicomonas sp.]|uniref:hypothetical protein n=1 Tax=Endozoicomonas sp. TaxID=1892382 RepID=UPI003D9ABF01
MSQASSKRIRQIEEQLIGGTGHRVLLVEGPDDVDAFSAWLTRSFEAVWENQWVVTYAGKKTLVLEILEQRPEWLGVVDRDEWSNEGIAEREQRHTNLMILPRYCIENYLIVPQELWDALPPVQQEKVQGGYETFEQKITSDLERWVKHGSLWAAVNPLWEGLRALGFKEALLAPEIVENDQVVRQKLEEWHSFLEPGSIYQNYQQKLNAAKTLEPSDQLRRCVHGKKFYDTVVNSVLNDLLGQMQSSERQRAILRKLAVPEDLQPLWQRMEL